MQRVAIGRALVRRPKALLMDEPIGALDAKLREQMRVELKRLHLENGSTSIYVTHDQVEAMSLADTVVVMHDGVLQQVGTPVRGVSAPGQPVRGPVHRLAGHEHRGRAPAARLPAGPAWSCMARHSTFHREALSMIASRPGKDIALGIRPEGVVVSHEEKPGAHEVDVHLVQPYGPFDIVDLTVGDSMLRARTASGYVSGKGQRVWASLDAAQAHFFDKSTGASLGFRLD